MESLQTIKRRIKGVQNINQITKAMELVAATKMRRSQEIALASRPYALTALEFLANLSRLEEIKMSPLLEKRPVRATAFVVVTSDKGLCGSFNSAVLRAFEKFAKEKSLNLTHSDSSFIAVGQKAYNFLRKKGVAVVERFVRVGDYTTIQEIKPLSDFLVGGYLKGRWDEAIVFSTHFRTALKQEVVRRRILPVDYERLKETAQEIIPQTGKFADLIKEEKITFFKEKARWTSEYLIEPSPDIILEQLIPHLVEMQVYHLVLEANASEHAARRVAMKNASDNASELADELTLAYNKARQAVITKEIVEITAAAEAINQ